MHVSALSDVGLVRKENQDNYLVSSERGLFVVADGMGGHLGGQQASAIAISALDRELRDLENRETLSALSEAMLQANELILGAARDEQYHGMGTTVTAAVIKDGELSIAHIGDSRAYLCRQGAVTQLTRDHSLVNELFQNGSLTLEEAQNHPQRNILTRALGTSQAEIDLFNTPLMAGDIILLCTDGLYHHVSDSELENVVRQDTPFYEKAQEMANMALDRGGSDNITIILVLYE